ncbi:NAD(P)/FAD-dependent oxidoreductase [Corynebacterium breve]|uniref:NAD(P)/FAD-dependent oxidoreductase n=1 Tax=Corynebacterium breve TaxID=3049799 RepID=A0ABY8VH36_9CORY|nr:NAD(P)/FAD-dependent oxidoreductase [Corynebacterium breve]WIM68402.1 NAD(P)/FAD-dependent oxidoreductase [Corynebacterium breve]
MTPLPSRTTVAILGAGQGGIALARHLSTHEIPYVLLEKARIAEAWRTQRWDNLVTNGPAWASSYPDQPIAGVDPHSYLPKNTIADYLENYVAEQGLTVYEHTAANEVTRCGDGFLITTTRGEVQARYVVVATGATQVPKMPLPPIAGVNNLHSVDYSNPAVLAPGAVVVVGGGTSAYQIAEELIAAGRKVFISVGTHSRVPRTYRGRDVVWWTGVLNHYESVNIPAGGTPSILMSGAYGGRTLDYRNLEATLVGRITGSNDGHLLFDDSLADTIAHGDLYYRNFLTQIDDFIATRKLDLPEEPQAHDIGDLPGAGPSSISVAEESIGTIIWATGYRPDISWLNMPELIDDRGRIAHRRGITAIPGLLFLGLPRQMRVGSGFVWGAWYDARVIADHIGHQEYLRSAYPQA